MNDDTFPCKELALGDLRHELVLTRRVLERIPEDHWDWKPHEKSFTLGDLALHVAALPVMQENILREDGLDVAESQTEDRVPSTRDAVLARFDSRCEAVRQALDELSEDDLTSLYTLSQGGRELFSHPRHVVLRSMGISHLIHHRAQLMVYLRLLDVPLPAIYGPTADEAPVLD
jgi:uncharacterized damage-inducible protein DinB